MLCVLIAALAIGGSQDYSYSQGIYSPMFRSEADAKLVLRYGNLLMEGPAGVREVQRVIRSGKPAERRAAALTMLHERKVEHQSFLLEFIDDKEIEWIAEQAISIDSKRAWPILLKMARAGNETATRRLYGYEALRESAYLALKEHKSPGVRLAALHGLARPELFEKALSDPDWNVTRGAVRWLLGSREYSPKLYFHEIDRVRVFAAEFTQRWSEADYVMWAKIARDPHPEVRYWAMYVLAAPWMAEPGRSAAIESVRLACVNGPPKVRTAAVHAIRCWMLGWVDPHSDESRRWPEDVKAKVHQILSTKAVRDELHRQALEEAREYINHMGTHPMLAAEAFARSSDSRAGATLERILEMDAAPVFNERSKYVFAYEFVKSDDVARRLHNLIYKTVGKTPRSGNVGNDLQATYNLISAMTVLSRLGSDVDADRFVAIANNRRLNHTLREPFLQALGHIDNPKTLRALIAIAKSSGESLALRANAIHGLGNNPSRLALETLTELRASPDRSTTMSARIAEENWLERFGGR